MACLARLLLGALLLVASALPAGAAEPAPALVRAVLGVAPEAIRIPGGYRFAVQDVAVSVHADEATGLLRVVARVGELTDREVDLVVGALGPDLVPDPATRVVSVRGLVCAAVLTPLRGLTDVVLRRTVDGAVRVARDAARPPDPATGFALSAPPGSLFPLPDAISPQGRAPAATIGTPPGGALR